MKRQFDFRKLAAIDIVFLGYKLVFVEYVFGVSFSIALGIFVLFRGHTVWQVVLGTYLICLGINYVPILAYTVSIGSKQNAQAELADELTEKRKAMSTYRRLSVFLLVPLLAPILAVSGATMKNKSIHITTVLAAVLVPVALFLHTFSASPLPKPEPYAGPLPSATPPLALAVFSVVTGVNHRVTAFGYRGGSLFEQRDFSMAGALVKHPKGDLLIDTGFGRNIDEQFRTLPWGLRAVTPYRVWKPAVDQMKAAGYDQKSLRAILLTHSHWDHVSGLPDFPGVPVWVTPQEHQFIRPGGQGQFGKSFSGIHYEEYGFEGGPYLGFPTSHDVYGDGSIIVVPAPGHTPGGVIIFVTLASGTRYAFVGDLVWQLEGITLREERPWITRRGSDSDAEGNRENLLRMIALKERLPELIIVPAHDMRPFAEMPPLGSGKQ